MWGNLLVAFSNGPATGQERFLCLQLFPGRSALQQRLSIWVTNKQPRRSSRHAVGGGCHPPLDGNSKRDWWPQPDLPSALPGFHWQEQCSAFADYVTW